MSKDKRNSKQRARVAKKKSSSVNKLKSKAIRRKLPALAKRKDKPAKKLKVVAAKPKVVAQKPEPKKAKTPIKSAKRALNRIDALLGGLRKPKGGRGGRKGRKEEWLLAAANAQLPKEDAETRRTRLKNLIKLGKDRGFLTYSEINDHLPDDLVDAEQIEAIISTFGDMGIQVYDQAPDQETLLISAESSTVATVDEDVEEQAEAALSTVDSEFGRTTDPLRMYMREMGSVELLTREGEIEIAKRIEEGLKHMIMAISACPMTVQQILDLAAKIEKDELQIDDLVDGLMDFNEELEAIEDEREEI